MHERGCRQILLCYSWSWRTIQKRINVFSRMQRYLQKLYTIPLSTKLFISCCNQSTLQRNNLVVLDTATGAIEPVIESTYSFTGMTQDKNYVYVISQTPGSWIYVIHKNTRDIVLQQSLENVKDPHSMVVNGENLYIVSAGTDQVLQYRFDREKLRIVFVKVIWSPKDSNMVTDTHHINSVFQYKNDIFISAFGLKESEQWSSAKKGYIYNITEKKKEMEPIYHPHSLYILNGNFYYCESSTRSVRKNNTAIIRLKSGYTRGLCVHNDYIFVGTSSGRKKSKSTGVTLNPADSGILEEDCRVLLYKKNFFGRYCLKNEFNLFPDHTEIYDIMVVQ